MSNLVFSSSPHLKAPKTTKGIMIDVCIALLPATIVGIVMGLIMFIIDKAGLANDKE